MTKVEEVEYIAHQLQEQYPEIGITYFPTAGINVEELKMIDILQQNLALLEQRDNDFVDVEQSLAQELLTLQKKELETQQLLQKLKLDMQKNKESLIRTKGYILWIQQNTPEI